MIKTRYRYGVTYDFAPTGAIDTNMAADDLERFADEPAPRAVPKAILKNLYAASSGLTLPRFVRIMPWVFFLPFFLIFLGMFPWNAPAALLMRLGWAKTTEGRAVSYAWTNMTVSSMGGPPLRVYKVNIEFAAPDGRNVATSCYVTGDDALPPGLANAAEASADGVGTMVRYFPPDPRCAVVPRGSLAMSYIFPLIFGVISLFSLAPVVYWRGRRKRFRTVLSLGEAATASIEGFEERNITINEQTVHRVRLRLESDRESVDSGINARDARLDFFRRCQAEGRKLRVLYLPDAPHRIALLGVEEAPEREDGHFGGYNKTP